MLKTGLKLAKNKTVLDYFKTFVLFKFTNSHIQFRPDKNDKLCPNQFSHLSFNVKVWSLCLNIGLRIYLSLQNIRHCRSKMAKFEDEKRKVFFVSGFKLLSFFWSKCVRY